jgi:hypothetical protein
MDINSIFAKPYGEPKKATTKSRFVAEELEEESMEEEQDFNPAQNSIFSSGSLFAHGQKQKSQLGQPAQQKELSEQLYQMLSQNLYHNQQSSVANPSQPFLGAQLGSPEFMMQPNDNIDEEYSSPRTAMRFEQMQMESIFAPGHEKQQHNSGPGLSSSSFANLRKRALDAGNEKLGFMKP